MNSLMMICRHYLRQLKNIPRESWVEQPEDAYVPYLNRDVSHLNIKYFKDVKKEINTNLEEEKLKPISAVMGPIKVEGPKIHNKKYRWCSCGQSLKQPFCDGSHEGTAFKPLRFSIEQSVKQVNLCGCKLSSNKPFCDGEACKQW